MLISSPWKIVPHRYYPQAQDSSKHNNIGQSLRKENILLNRNSEFSWLDIYNFRKSAPAYRESLQDKAKL